MGENTMLRRKQAAKEFGLCVSQTYVQESKGLIPKFISIGARAKALPQREVYAVNDARIAGKSDDEIREIVKTLMKQRNNFSLKAA